MYFWAWFPIFNMKQLMLQSVQGNFLGFYYFYFFDSTELFLLG